MPEPARRTMAPRHWFPATGTLTMKFGGASDTSPLAFEMPSTPPAWSAYPTSTPPPHLDVGNSAVYVADVIPPTASSSRGTFQWKIVLGGSCGCSSASKRLNVHVNAKTTRSHKYPVAYVQSCLFGAMNGHAIKAEEQGKKCRMVVPQSGILVPPTSLRRDMERLGLVPLPKPAVGAGTVNEKRQSKKGKVGATSGKTRAVAFSKANPKWDAALPPFEAGSNGLKNASRSLRATLKFCSANSTAKATQLLQLAATDAGAKLGLEKELEKELSNLRVINGAQVAAMKALRSKKMTAVALTTVGAFLSVSSPPAGQGDAGVILQHGLDLPRNAHTRGYVRESIKRRREFDVFVDEDDAIVRVGRTVRCRAGVGELLHDDKDTGDVVIKMDATGLAVAFGTSFVSPGVVEKTGRDKARLRLYVPSLLPDIDSVFSRAKQPRTVAARAAVREFHLRANYTSPNKKDTRRLRMGYNSYLTERAIYRHNTWDELWRDFRAEEPVVASTITNTEHPTRHPTLFRTAAPWQMVKGKEESCLCTSCESMSAVKRGQQSVAKVLENVLKQWEDRSASATATEASRLRGKAQRDKDVRNLRSIVQILTPDSKYEMCVAALGSCLPTGDLADAKSACEDGSCVSCGFTKLWSDGLRTQLFDVPYRPEKGKWVHKFKPSIDKDWMAEVFWAEYESQPVREKAANLKELDGDDEEYKTSVSNARECTLVTKSGCVTDFLDVFEASLTAHIPHRICHEVSKAADAMFHRNRRPFMFSKNVDYSENGPIENYRKLQQEHWVSSQYTLLISVYDWLAVDIWDSEVSTLKVGDTVTAHGEKSGLPVNPCSYFATVEAVQGNGMVSISNRRGAVETVLRSTLRHRVYKNAVCASVSDDRKHCRHQVQHFAEQEMVWLEAHLHKNHPLDLNTTHILQLHQHSDNASSHFKSTGAVEWFSRFAERQAVACQKAMELKDPLPACFTWTFGAPGHGKGLWDGLGGMLKSKAKSIVRGAQSSKTATVIPGTGSIALRSAVDVHAMLLHHFQSEEWIAEAKASKKRILTIELFLSSQRPKMDPIHRPSPPETFSLLDGISSRYQFHVISRGLVDMRVRPCWCAACMASISLRLNVSSGQESHTVCGCSNAQNKKYDFVRRACEKKTGRDMTVEVAFLSNLKHERTKKCQAIGSNDWLLFKSADQTERLWLGRAAPREQWQQQPTWRNNTLRQKKNWEDTGMIHASAGDYLIYVQWYDFVQSTPNGREYKISKNPYHEPTVNNQMDLVAVGLHEHIVQVTGTAGSSMARRRAPRNFQTLNPSNNPYAAVLNSVMTTNDVAYQTERGKRYEMTHAAYESGLKELDRMLSM